MVLGPNRLIGREIECQRLTACWAQALAGHPRVVCLVGEAGAGKSAIMHWLAKESLAGSTSARAVWLSPPAATDTGLATAARALEGLYGLKAGPLAEVEETLRSITGGAEPDVVRYEASLVMQLFGDPWPQPQDPARFQSSALALARRLVVAYAARHPVLLLLDAIHRTDRLARQWVADLLADSRTHPCQLLVVGSTTPAREADLHPLTRECVAEQIRLEPLDDTSAGELLAARLQSPVPASDIECALGAARGNPACLEAFGTALGLGLPLPSSWEAAVRTEVEGLGPGERSLVDALAVVNGPAPAPLLERIAGFERAEALPGLPALLVESATGIWFRHSAVAVVCQDLLSPAARSRLHRRAGAVFEPAFPLIAARHFERAGDRESLLRSLGVAARSASSRFALEEARELLQRALDSTPGDSCPPAELALNLASIDITLGAFNDALEMLSLRAARLEGIDRARAFRLMGRSLERKGEYAAARAHIQEGLDIPGDLPATERSGLLADAATILMRQGQMDEARRNAEQALALLVDSADAPEFALAHSVLGITFYRQGRFSQALSHHHIALERRESARDIQGMARSLNNIGNVQLDAGTWDEALAAFRRAISLSEACGDAQTRTAALNNLASLHLAREELPEAEAACRESLECKTRMGETPGIGIALATLAAILGHQGRTAEALAATDEAISLLEQLGEREVLCDIYACRGELLLHAGDREDAWSALSRAQILAQEVGRVAIVARVYRVLSEISRRDGHADDSLAFAREAVDLNRFLPRKLELARSLLQLGLAGGDDGGEAKREALEIFGSLGVAPSEGAVRS